MSQRISRHFVRVRDREVHYRRVGEGPPLVVFHVSPQTSAFVVPHFLPIADRFTIIGLDSPGFGGSDPLPMPFPTAADYGDAALEAMDALGIGRAAVYGAHTGAHIALELANRHSARCALLVLDGLSINTAAEARERLERYAPTFIPREDGSHLAWAWQHSHDQTLFAPWYLADQAHRLDSGVHDSEKIHDIVLSKMAATNYSVGYRAAFSHEPRRAVTEITVPTILLAREGDWRADLARKLEGLPGCVSFLDVTSANEVAKIGTAMAGMKADPIVPPPPPVTARMALYRSYRQRGEGQRLVRRGGTADGLPLVLLHDAMGGTRLLDACMRLLGVRRPVIAIDIAGNADSDPLPAADPGIAAFAADMLRTLDGEGVTRFDLYGEGLGAVLALAIARDAPTRVHKLVLDRPVLATDDERADLLANFAPPMPARWDGTHLITAWHMLRDGAMFWPWYRRTRAGVRWSEPEIEPVALQMRLIEWLKGKETYAAFARAALAAPAAPLLLAAHPTLVLTGTDAIMAAYGQHAAAALPQAQLAVSRAAGDTVAIGAFLDHHP